MNAIRSALALLLLTATTAAFAQSAPTITSAEPPNALLNQPYEFQVTASGNPIPTFAATTASNNDLVSEVRLHRRQRFCSSSRGNR